MRRTALIVVPVALAVGAAAFAPPAGAAKPSVTFGVPRVVDPIHVYGEPNLEVNPRSGAIHATGPQGTGTQRSIWNVSVDGGDSYRIVQNLPANTDQLEQASGAVPTKSALGAGGGDTEIKIAHNGRAFFNDLAALASFTAVSTDDDGAHTSVANPAAIGFPVGDRQWMALFDPQPSDRTVSPYKGPRPLDYMEYADQVNGDAVDMTTDGTTYTVAGEYANDNVHQPNHGVPLVDQHTGRFLGMTSGKSGNSLALVVGVPSATGLLTFHYNEMVKGLPGSPETLFPVLAQDGARNLYAVWVDDKTFQVWYSWAAPGADNEWRHWSTPRQISKAPADVNVFPWVAAGKAPGILDVAWYGTKSTLAQLGTQGPSAKKGQTWDLWFSQVSRANGSAPVLAQVKAAPHPMHYNDICLLGTACITGQGNRNQADFFKLVVDPRNGRARIIYTDSSNRLSQTVNSDTAADHQGAALDTVVTQNTGLDANTGKPLAPYESTAPVRGITDPAGDSLFKPLGGTYLPGADILSVGLRRTSSTLDITVKTKSDLASAAAAAGVASAQLVVRWQMGDTLYFASAEQTAAGGPVQFFAGRSATVDLCSVSGCKPNYLTYNQSATSSASGSTDGGYRISVPLAVVGNPSASSLLEEVMAFVTVNPKTGGLVPQDNVSDVADEAPLQVEGTRTFNYRAAAGGPVTAALPRTSSSGAPANGTSSGALAATGLGTTAPALALVLLGAGLLVRRRRTG
ncbi:MAG: hypothetical protein WCD35_07050 [Mycobacteriales bacterium]